MLNIVADSRGQLDNASALIAYGALTSFSRRSCLYQLIPRTLLIRSIAGSMSCTSDKMALTLYPEAAMKSQGEIEAAPVRFSLPHTVIRAEACGAADG